MKPPLIAALITVAFLIGTGVGYLLTPEYRVQSAQMKAGHDLGPADRWLDQRYLDGMIAHHLSAIHLLQQAAQYSQRPQITELAATVIAADQADIELLYQQKREWYGNSRRITQYQQVNLGTADAQFDLRLLNALLAHHQQAIDQAEEVLTKSSRNQVLDRANRTIAALTTSAEELRRWRKEWYGIE